MDVRDLAPSLIALGQALDRANSLLNGDQATISLNIRATRPACFEVGLVLQQLVRGADDILSGDFFTNAATLIELLVGGPTVSVGVFKLAKWLKGRKPDIVQEGEEGIVLEVDKLRLSVPVEVARLWNDGPLREQLEAFVRPLQREGAGRVVFKDEGKELESLARDEAEYFNVGYENEEETEYIIPRQRLQITSLTFRKGKWKLSDGGNVHWYAMEDEAFADSIEKGVRFGKNDILVCEVLMTQRLDDSGKLKLDYAVMRVLRHITSSQQLPFSEGDNGGEAS